MKVNADKLAALIAFLVGAPFAFVMVTGFADSEIRRYELPIRAMLSNEVFEAFREGEKAPQHYYGNDRLAPDFTLQDQYGKTFKLSDMRGKTVVMNFWTVTCKPCVEEMPSFETLALIAAERDDLEVIAVTTDRSWEDVKSLFSPASKVRVLFDPDKQVVREKFGTRLYPETWIIDGRGVIRARVDGARDWAAPIALDMIENLSS